MIPTTKRVIVIGAGVAGIAAAATLVRNGKYVVTLLEADDRIGGRVYSKEFGSHVVEMGAEWIHGQVGNPVFEAIQAVAPDLLNTTEISDDKFWSDVGYTYVTSTGTKLDFGLNQAITQFMNVMEQDPKNYANDRSLSKSQVASRYFKDIGQLHGTEKVSKAAINWIERYWNAYDCTDNWEEASYAGTTLDYIEVPGIRNIPWNAPANSTTLLKIILEGSDFNSKSQLVLPPWIKLKKEVTYIDWSDEKRNVAVKCEDRSLYFADHVICTIPLGVLKRHQASLFRPKLSERKVKAIQSLGYGTVNKLYFEFPSAWWGNQFKGVNLLWIENDHGNRLGHMSRQELLKESEGFPMWCRGLLNFHRVDTHPTALRSWLSGEAARLVETLEDLEVQTVCMKVLRKFMGDSYSIPEPNQFLATKWNSNPFSRGTYSFRTITSEIENVWATDVATPVQSSTGKPVICFGGEATDRNFYSSLHGAYASGLREANRLMQYEEK